jgi:cytochrome c5
MSRFISTALCTLLAFSICSTEASAVVKKAKGKTPAPASAVAKNVKEKTSAPASVTYNAAAGKALYETSCTACHKTGLMGAPKLGDKLDWAPRIKQGIEVLVSHADKGFSGKKGTMPAKGGNAKLTTAEIGNAVAFMVDKSK